MGLHVYNTVNNFFNDWKGLFYYKKQQQIAHNYSSNLTDEKSYTPILTFMALYSY